MRLKARQIESWFVALGLLEQRQTTADYDLDRFLLSILRDGSILCRLVNRLKPGAIIKVRGRSGVEKQRNNVQVFCHVNEFCPDVSAGR